MIAVIVMSITFPGAMPRLVLRDALQSYKELSSPTRNLEDPVLFAAV